MQGVAFLTSSPWGLTIFTWSFLLQTLITGNTKHVREPEWTWKGRTCLLGSGNLHIAISGEPCSMHASEKQPGGCSTLSKAEGLPSKFKGQRVYYAQNLWVSDRLKRGSFCTCRLTSTLCSTKRFFKIERYVYIFTAVALHLGSVIPKRTSISQMVELMWAFFFITWPRFRACRRCGMWGKWLPNNVQPDSGGKKAIK